jgi:hypothetical protein
MKKYTIGLLDCEIDVELASEEELELHKADEKVLYINDENGEPVFVDAARTFAAIMKF